MKPYKGTSTKLSQGQTCQNSTLISQMTSSRGSIMENEGGNPACKQKVQLLYQHKSLIKMQMTKVDANVEYLSQRSCSIDRSEVPSIAPGQKPCPKVIASASSLHYYSQATAAPHLHKPPTDTPKSLLKPGATLEGALMSQTFDHRHTQTTGARKQQLLNQKTAGIQ